MHSVRETVFEVEEKRISKMVNRRFGAVIAFIVALATQTYSKYIDAEEARDILNIIQYGNSEMPESKTIDMLGGPTPMELPATERDKDIVRVILENAGVRMRSMPPDEEEEDEPNVSPPTNSMMRSIDDVMKNLQLVRTIQVLHSQMRSTPVDDTVEQPPFPPIDRIGPFSIPIVDMDPDTVYKIFGFRRPDSMMRSMLLDIRQLNDDEILRKSRAHRELLM